MRRVRELTDFHSQGAGEDFASADARSDRAARLDDVECDAKCKYLWCARNEQEQPDTAEQLPHEDNLRSSGQFGMGESVSSSVL